MKPANSKKPASGGPLPEMERAPAIKSYMQALQARVAHKCTDGYIRASVSAQDRTLHSSIFTYVPCPLCNPIAQGGPLHTHLKPPTP